MKLTGPLIGLGLFLAVVLATLALLLKTAGVRSPLADPYHVAVVLPGADNLAAKADVRIGGIKVGQVEKVRAVGDTAVAKLALNNDAGPIYDDARVQLRSKSVLNEGYIDLEPGGGTTAEPVPDNGDLPISRADQAVQIDEVLSTLDRRTRKSLQRVLDETGPGLDGKGKSLNGLFAAGSDLVDRADPAFRTLTNRRRQLGALVDDIGQITAALGAREAALRTLASRSKQTAEAVAARDDQLRSTFGELGPTVRQARSTAAVLGNFSPIATPVVRDLRVALDQLDTPIRRLLPAAKVTRGTVAEIGRLNPRAKPLLAQLRTFADQGQDLPDGADESLRQLNPLSGYLSSQKRNILAFFSNYTGATQSSDQTGHVNRLSFLINRAALTAFLGPDQIKTLKTLEDAGIFEPLSGKVQYNAYPAEGQIANPKPFTGRYRRLEADPAALGESSTP